MNKNILPATQPLTNFSIPLEKELFVHGSKTTGRLKERTEKEMHDYM